MRYLSEDLNSLAQQLAPHLKAYIVPWLPVVTKAGAGSGSGTTVGVHDLAGSLHSGTLRNDQGPQFLLKDGSRNLTGNLSVDAGVTIDGVDIDAFYSAYLSHNHDSRYLQLTGGTLTGALLLPAGAAATPALSFSGDTNLGLYRIGTDILGIATNGVERMRIDANGYVNIGGVNANYPLYLNRNFGTLPAGQSSLSYFNAVGTGDAGGTTDLRTLQFTVSAQGTNNFTGVAAVVGDVYNQMNSGTASNLGVMSANIRMPSAGNTTTASGYRIIALLSGAGSITNYRGFEARSPSVTGAGTITNAYGIDIPAQKVTGVTNGWGVYQSGINDINYFNGNVGIGTNNPSKKLHVSGDVKLGTFFQLDNTLKSLGVGITPDGAALADFQAVNASDHTMRIKQLTSQTGRLWRVEDTSGNELLVMDSQGNLQSGQPGFVSGLTGWQITPPGNAEFNNAFIRGELHASIFVMDEFHASGGTLFIATAGKLENPWTINLSTGTERVLDIRTTAAGTGTQLDIRTTATGTGTQLTTRSIEQYIDITDPPSGHAMIFQPGQTLRLKSIGQITPGIDLYDIWAKVMYIEDQTAFYRYYLQIWSGGTHGAVIPAGTADISYGKKGDGRIMLTSDLNYAPYMDVFTVGEQPWLGEITPHVRIGRLDGVGVPGVSGIQQYGMVAGTDLSNANSPYFVISNLKQYMYRIGSEWNNGIDPTVTISPDGRFKIGYDVSDPNRTVFDFDPALGTLNIGSAAYPFAVSLVGNMTIQNPGAIATSTLNNDAGWTVGATWGTNLTGIPAPLGAPSGAGLYLGASQMGYYNGSSWRTYMDNTGKFYFAGASGATLAWDGTDLYGTDGTTVQWYARASTGKFNAGAGAVVLDANGVTLTNDTTETYSAQAEKNAITFNRSGVGTIGRLTSYYLSGTTAYGLDAYAMSPNSELVTTRLRAIAQGNIYGGTAVGAPTVLLTSGASDYAKIYAAIIQLFATTNTTPSIEAVANQVRIYDDLRVDGATNHVLGIRTTA